MKASKKDKSKIIWVLIYTKAKQEIKASENLQKQGFKTFLPLIAPNNKNSGIKNLVPVFPRYFFAQIDFELENWASINSSYGVSHIVMFGEKFTSIPNNIIKLIQDRLDESGVYKKNISIVDYQEGDPVTIKEGSFAGINAIFLSNKSKDRVRLLLNLLNTTIVSELDKSDIGHKEVIENFKF